MSKKSEACAKQADKSQTDATDSKDSKESNDSNDSNGSEERSAAVEPAHVEPIDENFEPLLPQQLSEAQEEIAQLKDELLRAKAEVENIRRRSQNEIVTARKFAVEGFARELLAVNDSLEQAANVKLEHNSEALKQMKEGLSLTVNQFDIALGKFSVVAVEATPNMLFNPDTHQAISALPSEEIEPNHIVAVVQKGFMLKDRLLRPAMVVVAKAQN